MLLKHKYEITGLHTAFDSLKVKAVLKAIDGVVSFNIMEELATIEIVMNKKIETSDFNAYFQEIGIYRLVDFFVLNGKSIYLNEKV